MSIGAGVPAPETGGGGIAGLAIPAGEPPRADKFTRERSFMGVGPAPPAGIAGRKAGGMLIFPGGALIGPAGTETEGFTVEGIAEMRDSQFAPSGFLISTTGSGASSPGRA